MENVREEFKLKCPNGNPALNACGNPECVQVSLICCTQECECRKLHKKCSSFSEVKKLQELLEDKGQSYQPIIREVYNSYDNQAKQIALELEYVNKLMDKKQLFLVGNESLLYSMMKEGKSQLIIPQLVAYVMKSVQKQPVHDISARMEETKKSLKKAEDQFKKLIDGVRKLTEVGSVAPPTGINLDDLRFSAELRSQNLSIINNQIVKVTNQDGNFWAALLQPCLPRSKCKSCKVNFKVNKVTSNYLMFGVCQLTPNIKIIDKNTYNVIEYGSFTYCGDTVYLGKSEVHRKESMNIDRYQTNDLVQVEYESETEKVTVRNKTQNTQSVSYIKTDNNLPLYVGVILKNKDDEVQITDGECKQ